MMVQNLIRFDGFDLGPPKLPNDGSRNWIDLVLDQIFLSFIWVFSKLLLHMVAMKGGVIFIHCFCRLMLWLPKFVFRSNWKPSPNLFVDMEIVLWWFYWEPKFRLKEWLQKYLTTIYFLYFFCTYFQIL